MRTQQGRLTIGLLLIAFGVLALFGPIEFSDIVESYLFLGIGVAFLALYYLGGRTWAIWPGAFTLPFGIVVWLTVRGVDMDVWWPLFIAAPGVGFLIIRSAGDHRWAIYPGAFFILFAGIMFAMSSGALSWYGNIIGKFWPIALILAGLTLILRSFGPRYRQSGPAPTEPR